MRRARPKKLDLDQLEATYIPRAGKLTSFAPDQLGWNQQTTYCGHVETCSLYQSRDGAMPFLQRTYDARSGHTASRGNGRVAYVRMQGLQRCAHWSGWRSAELRCLSRATL